MNSRILDDDGLVRGKPDGDFMNMTYDSMLEYAMREDRLGEEFFQGRMRILGESVNERLQQLEAREQTHEQLLRSVERERDIKERQLRFFTYKETATRVTLMNHVEALNREARTEMVRFRKDAAQLSREAREKLEEYEGMAQLFSALAVTRREARGDGP